MCAAERGRWSGLALVRRLGLLLAAASLWLSGCAAIPSPGLAEGAQAGPALMPIRAFFANRDSRGGFQVSPDGQWLAWIAASGTGPALFLRPLAEPASAERMVMRGIGNFSWAADSRHVLISADRQGDENFHVLSLDVLADEPHLVDLTPFAGATARLHQIRTRDRNQILITHNRRDPREFDLYRVDVSTGRQTLVFSNPGNVRGYITDRDGGLVGLVRQQAGGYALHVNFQHQMGLTRELLRWSPQDHVAILATDSAGPGFYLLTNQGRDKQALAYLDAKTGAQQLLLEDPAVDLEAVIFSQLSGQPLAGVSSPGYPRLSWLDADWQREMEAFFPDRPRRLVLLSRSDDEQLLTAMVDTDTDRQFFLLDRRARTRLDLGPSSRRAWADRLSPTRPIRLVARDGLPLQGYLTLPHKGVLPEPEPGLPRQPGPMVLLVHGGPWARDHWDNSLSQVQFLASRGYAVLQVNYRGSTGYGRRFMQAGVGEFAGRMHTDLLDAVQWAVDQRVADPQRVAIMGASYGGYATLVGLSQTPDTFACGVDQMGLSNLVSFLENVPPTWLPSMSTWYSFVGDPRVPAQREKLVEKSPITHAEAITKPLLVIQAANDVRVRQEQSDQMVEALRALGKPVQYHLYGGTGHLASSWGWGTQLRAHRAIEDFLATCLGGRSAGFDYYELAAWMY